ncbi:hypothetical protein [Legionella maioricensis]|uniref:Uncharacterized protein n=1 Tax=Legionella maioricensis TaxID=2896528 RepID=A0A9X2D2V2_9GAMM|nr:hypothetical protein [Legionella maioricensis]MCL9685304.1 hypothetical protein [Legionella maioricensis]MCL9688559.1 hypothetical protein [Legionella maioricensis]
MMIFAVQRAAAHKASLAVGTTVSILISPCSDVPEPGKNQSIALESLFLMSGWDGLKLFLLP